MIKASLFLWLVLLPLLLKAQSDTCLIKIKGKISDNHNSQPLSFAKIFIISNNAGYESDVNGNYLINNICKGILKIRLEHIECESQYIEINLMHDTIINFLLEHHAHLLKEIEVNESKSEVSSLYNRYQLNEWELMDSRGLTLSEGLKKVPGITALNTGSSISKPMIHGLQGNRILILNNGVRLEGQQWGNEHAPEIDAFSAGEITVVKGAMSVRYGSDALGGVLLIEPKTLPDSGKLSGNTFTTLQSNGLQASNATMLQGVFYSFGKLQYRINGTFKKAGNIHTPNYRLDNTGIEEKDFS
ncbi:MAG: TonB-dependent receptor plug domain-containing protein, partial [Bacteroidia bacterium]|nr:TonB-dependent receptor plug domain-containing protein [Bacteroidia bacterium]